jgi:hypothetical protein
VRAALALPRGALPEESRVPVTTVPHFDAGRDRTAAPGLRRAYPGSAVVVASAAGQRSRTPPNGVEHLFGQATREGVLLRGVVRPEKRDMPGLRDLHRA